MQMHAMVLEEFGGKLTYATLPVREPGAGEVLVRVVACGAGLTLENVRAGTLGGTTPRIMGHEFSGSVVRVGVGVEGWDEGDPVTGSFYLFCGYCNMCASGRETLCINPGGYIGSQIDGAFAEYIIVPSRNLVRIPEDVALREAGVIADAVATPYHVARERAKIVPGQRVAVLGAGGGVGVHMLQVAKAFGAFVIAVERDPAKLARLHDFDVDAIVDSQSASWKEDLVDAAQGQLDAYIDFVGTPETLTNGVAALGRAGTLVVVGVPPNMRSSITADPMHLILNEIVITAARYATRTEIAQSLELVRSGKVRTVIGASFPLARTEDAFEAIRRNEIFGRIIIDCSTDA